MDCLAEREYLIMIARSAIVSGTCLQILRKHDIQQYRDAGDDNRGRDTAHDHRYDMLEDKRLV